MKDIRIHVLTIGDMEMFEYDRSDYDRLAKKYYNLRANVVQIRTCAYFRWSFVNWFDDLNRCFLKICQAFHRYNITVIDHFSSIFNFHPLNEYDKSVIERFIVKLGSSINTWGNFFQTANHEQYINNIPFSSMYQVDEYKKPIRAQDPAYAFCYNNKNFQDQLIEYVKQLTGLGIDGIYSFDYLNLNCMCRYCKSKFEAYVGKKLENNVKWKQIIENNLQMKRLWMQFKIDSATQLALKVIRTTRNQSKKNLILNLAYNRPGNDKPYYQDNKFLKELDCNIAYYAYSSVIKYGCYNIVNELAYHSSVCKKLNIKPLYSTGADRWDTYYFSWALSKMFNADYFSEPEGVDITPFIRKTASFEEKNKFLFNSLDKISDVAILNLNQDMRSSNRAKLHSNTFLGVYQSLFLENVQTDVYQGKIEQTALNRYKTVVLPNCEINDTGFINNLIKYVKSGGTLVIIGIIAVTKRYLNPNIKKALRLLGLEYNLQKRTENTPVKFYDSKDNEYTVPNCPYEFTDIKYTNTKYLNRNRYATETPTGQGNIIHILPNVFHYMYNGVKIFRWHEYSLKTRYSCGDINYKVNKVNRPIVKDLFVKHSICDKNRPLNYHYTMYKRKDKKQYVINLINLDGIIPDKTTYVSHEDKIHPFDSQSGYINPYSDKYFIYVKNEPGETVLNIRLYTIEKQNEIYLNYKIRNEYIEVELHPDMFNGYGIIEILLA